MGNTAGTLFSALGQAIGKVLGHPLDFLSGKSCKNFISFILLMEVATGRASIVKLRSVCAPTWDFTCYIENFCVGQLLKCMMAAMMVYFVLLFLYLLYNLGICQCMCHTLCRTIWACFATCFSALDFCCSHLCYKLRAIRRTRKRRRRRRKRDIEEFGAPISCSTSGDEYELEERSVTEQHRNLEHGRSHFNRRRNYKDEYLRRSLRPMNHRAHVVFSSRPPLHQHGETNVKNIGGSSSPLHHHIRVARSSKFSRKGSSSRNGIYHMRRYSR